MSEQKVKLSFEFGRKDYEHIIYLLDLEKDPDVERFWNAMVEKELEIPLEFLAEQTGVKKSAVSSPLSALSLPAAKSSPPRSSATSSAISASESN